MAVHIDRRPKSGDVTVLRAAVRDQKEPPSEEEWLP
jgi:hypothetical protein